MDDHDFDEDIGLMQSWGRSQTTHRKCQWCKQQRDCRHGPDPYLFFFFDEIEMVWLCDDCFALREDGGHLPEGEDEI